MTEKHEVIVQEDLEYIAQAERINNEGLKTITLKRSSENQMEISIQRDAKGPGKERKTSKGFLGTALKFKSIRNPFRKPKK